MERGGDAAITQGVWSGWEAIPGLDRSGQVLPSPSTLRLKHDRTVLLLNTKGGITPAFGDEILYVERPAWHGTWNSSVSIRESGGLAATGDIAAATFSGDDLLVAYCDPTDGRIKEKRRTGSGEWMPGVGEVLDFGGTMIDVRAVHSVDNAVDLIARGWDTNLYHRRFSLYGQFQPGGTLISIPKLGAFTL